MKRRIGVAVSGVALLSSALLGAQPASAVPADKNVTLTSEQLTDQGFPTTPNVTAWGPGGAASLPTTTAPQWQDVIITGKAPTMTQPGQLLTMSRFVPADTKGDGSLKALNITAVVQPDRSFTLHFQLGMPGTYGYSVGYSTRGATPEVGQTDGSHSLLLDCAREEPANELPLQDDVEDDDGDGHQHCSSRDDGLVAHALRSCEEG